MTSEEWVRATNAVTALEQCGHGLAKAIQDALAALTMAEAVLTRTRAWLADAEPSVDAPRVLAEGQKAPRNTITYQPVACPHCMMLMDKSNLVPHVQEAHPGMLGAPR